MYKAGILLGLSILYLVVPLIDIAAVTYCDQHNLKRLYFEKNRYIQLLEYKFGKINYIKFEKLSICIARTKFTEVPGGVSRKSYYDRKENRIFLRSININNLRHELNHFYLEMRFGEIPYLVSEYLTNCIKFSIQLNTKVPFKKSITENVDKVLISIMNKEIKKNELPSSCHYIGVQLLNLTRNELWFHLDK